MTRTAAPARPRSAWWRWRHDRPFWGGLLVTVAGAEILLTVQAPLPVVVHVGMQGLAGYLVPMVLLLCGILLLFNPSQRVFYSLVAAGLSLGSWITSNLGGFILGLLLGLVGSALAFAWAPRAEPTPSEPTPSELDPSGSGPTESGPTESTLADLNLAEPSPTEPSPTDPEAAPTVEVPRGPDKS